MRTIAIANQKGGCGKTTTSVNLAAALAEAGKRTLLVDLDPQGHSTIGFGYNPDELNNTIFDVITDFGIEIPTITLGTNMERLDLLPSNVALSGAELELADIFGREFVLREKLRTVENNYDVCIIDCPPSLSMLTLNALVASTDVVVPVQAHYYAMEGLKQLFETAEMIRTRFYPCYVKILGILLTFVEDKTLLSRQIKRQMREYFGEMVFETVIHKNVRLAEAPSSGEPIMIYAPENKATVEYRALAREIIKGKFAEDLTDDNEAFVRRKLMAEDKKKKLGTQKKVSSIFKDVPIPQTSTGDKARQIPKTPEPDRSKDIPEQGPTIDSSFEPQSKSDIPATEYTAKTSEPEPVADAPEPERTSSTPEESKSREPQKEQASLYKKINQPTELLRKDNPYKELLIDVDENDAKPGLWKRIRKKIFTSKPGSGSTRQKTTVLLIPVLASVFILMLRQAFLATPHKTEGALESEKPDTVTTNSTSNKIDWQIPTLFSSPLRNPITTISPGKAQSNAKEIELQVNGILHSKDNPAALIGDRIVHEGDKISGVTILKINKDSVEFEMNGKKWKRSVQK